MSKTQKYSTGPDGWVIVTDGVVTDAYYTQWIGHKVNSGTPSEAGWKKWVEPTPSADSKKEIERAKRELEKARKSDLSDYVQKVKNKRKTPKQLKSDFRKSKVKDAVDELEKHIDFLPLEGAMENMIVNEL